LSRERWTVGITAFATAAVVAGCVILIPTTGTFGPLLLVRTAIATSLGLVAAAIVGALLVRRTAGAFAPLGTLLRVPFAMALVVAVGTQLPWLGPLMALLETAAMAALVIAVLVLTRELGAADLALVRKSLFRGASR